MQLIWWGKKSYNDTTQLQQEFHSKVLDGRLEKGAILAGEHEAVITLGKRSDPSQDLLWSEKEIFSSGLSICTTDRGGEATLHNPGQLVIYPILNISKLGMGVKDYVRTLERTTLDLLHYFGVQAVSALDGEPGIYVGPSKLVSFGVRVDRGVSLHGLALNVKNDLSQFRSIRVCGVVGQQVTSLERLRLKELDLQNLAARWQLFLEKRLEEYKARGYRTTADEQLALH